MGGQLMIDWVEDEDGSIARSTPMSDELGQVFQNLRQAFIDKHGREPGPDDPVFPDMPHPEHLEHMMVEGMKQAGVDPAMIYAFEKTGRLVSEENQNLIPDADLAEWNAAVEEYYRKHSDRDDVPEYPFATIAFYGPDDQTTTKVVAGVFPDEDAEAILKRWIGTGVQDDPKVQGEIEQFFKQHGVRSVGVSEARLSGPGYVNFYVIF